MANRKGMVVVGVVERAGRFLQQQGRDIDRAEFAYHFGAGTHRQEEVLEVLGRYQDPDGGFGHGLEPDITAPDSNPFATDLALQVCLRANVPRENALLRRTVEYLEATQDADGGWRFAPEIYEHELAPWFRDWTWPALNPACQLAGHLRALGLGSKRLHGSVEALFDRLARPADLLGGYYAVLPYAYYFLPDSAHPRRELYLSGVLWWLIRQHVEGRIEDSAHFFDYARSPRTTTGRLLPAPLLAERLDLLAAEQRDDGGWPTPYAEHWRGAVTVQNLLVLRAFGRV